MAPVKPVWFLTSSATLSEGVTSQGMVVPLMTPLDRASVTCGTGMPIGSAPRRPSMSEITREPPRIFMPARSSSLVTGFWVWNRPGPWVCTAIRCTPSNSSMALASTYFWNATEVASAEVTRKGISNTSDLGKRPGV
ncbi:hypothetical protein D3C72_1690190 [compost metagenome]